MAKRIAIIGAGLAGLTLASRLKFHADVTVFEKARGVGGRMSTRHHDHFTFDHGNQFFTVRDKKFADFLAPYQASGLVQEWTGKVITLAAAKKATDRLWFEPHYVACPGMNGLCKELARNIDVQLNVEVASLIDRRQGQWHLCDKNGRSLGAFDLVVSTAPPVQTCRLFHDFLPDHAKIRQSKFMACYTLMVGFSRAWDKTWIAAKIQNSPLEWIAVNSTKPARNHDITTWVVHSTNAWAETHVDNDLKQVEDFLRDELKSVLNIDFNQPDCFSLHRWRYALLDKAHDDHSRDAAYFDPSLQLACVGDWGSRSRVEDVWLEANQLAGRILVG